MVRAVGSLVLGLAVALASAAAGSPSLRAVEAFVSRLGNARVTDLTITETLTIYQPDGRHPQSTQELRVYLKPPGRQRVEQTIGGRRQIHLIVGDQAWVRHPDGRVDEVTGGRRDRDLWHLCGVVPPSAETLLAEWRAAGVRPDISHLLHVRGRPVTVIGAGPGDRTSPAVWIDPEYGVVRIITRERGPGLVDRVCSEHRPLRDGLHFPYRQELFAEGGTLVLRILVRGVEINTNLADALFDPRALRRGR